MVPPSEWKAAPTSAWLAWRMVESARSTVPKRVYRPPPELGAATVLLAVQSAMTVEERITFPRYTNRPPPWALLDPSGALSPTAATRVDQLRGPVENSAARPLAQRCHGGGRRRSLEHPTLVPPHTHPHHSCRHCYTCRDIHHCPLAMKHSCLLVQMSCGRNLSHGGGHRHLDKTVDQDCNGSA